MTKYFFCIAYSHQPKKNRNHSFLQSRPVYNNFLNEDYQNNLEGYSPASTKA